MAQPTSSLPLWFVLIDGGIRDRNPVRRAAREVASDCRLIEVASAEAWTEALQRAAADLVIADFPVRWSAGVDLVRVAKARWPKTPVIMVTGAGSDAIAAEAKQAGVDDYLEATPEGLMRLPTTIRDAVARSRNSSAGPPDSTDGPAVDLAPAMEDAADAILAIDCSGLIRYANRAMERLVGRTRPEILGQPLHLLINGIQTLESLMDAWRRLGCGGNWRGVVAIQGEHGRSGEVETAVSPIPGEAGLVMGYLLVARDVASDRQVDLQRRQVHTMEGIARFAGGVAHAYNNFLMTVMGYTELLKDQLPDSGTAFQEIADIKASCEEAAAFTRQLLTFSRKQVRQLAYVDVHRVLAGLEGRLRQVLGDAIALEMTSEPHPAPVRIDRDRLEHGVLDLAGYARDVRSGGAFRIGVRTVGPLVAAESSAAASKARSWVEVRVTYAGPRLDAEARARVFEPAFPKGRKGQRIDLRLATLYTMIRQSGGRIDVAGSPEGETTFTIHLPHADSSPEQ